MNDLPLLESMKNWTPEQQLAVHDFCQLMADTIWQHHSDQLIDYLRCEKDACRIDWPEQPLEQNLQLPFDDDMPF